MSMFGLPVDPENGWSPFEYARHICALLQRIWEALTGSDRDADFVTRFLTQQGVYGQATFNGAGANDAQVEFRVPAGFRWKLLGYVVVIGVAPGGAVDGSATVYRNDTTAAGVIDTLPQSVGGRVGKNAPVPFTIEENTRILFTVTRLADTVGIPATVNIIVEQVMVGDPAPSTEEGGDY